MAVEIAELAANIDRLFAAGPSALSDGASLCHLERQHSRLECFISKVADEFEMWGEWGNEGAKNAASWISVSANVPIKTSRRQLKRGRVLGQLPILSEAYASGEVTTAHVDDMVAVKNARTDEALLKDEAELVERAKKLYYSEFTRSLAYWEQSADPDGVEEDAAAQRERRDAYPGACVGGMHMGKMTLDPISGAIVGGEWDRLEHELFQADWAEAKERLGHEPKVDELSRTPAQRRVDALVEMATRSSGAGSDVRRLRPLFSVFVGYETLHGRICELANGTPITPGCLLPWLEEADMERAVFSPGARVEVSATSRFFTGATRRALELRDRRCTHPLCDVPLDHCQADHIQMASQGGPTVQDNGRLLCGYHNRLRNQRPPPAD
jgi:uncharacterized protein DUF222